MSTELRETLQETWGEVCILERELGGAGMSRVFVARDAALGRRIVVKVLPPEMAGAVNLEGSVRRAGTKVRILSTHRRMSTSGPRRGLRHTPRFQNLLRKIGPPESLPS